MKCHLKIITAFVPEEATFTAVDNQHSRKIGKSCKYWFSQYLHILYKISLVSLFCAILAHHIYILEMDRVFRKFNWQRCVYRFRLCSRHLVAFFINSNKQVGCYNEQHVILQASKFNECHSIILCILKLFRSLHAQSRTCRNNWRESSSHLLHLRFEASLIFVCSASTKIEVKAFSKHSAKTRDERLLENSAVSSNFIFTCGVYKNKNSATKQTKQNISIVLKKNKAFGFMFVSLNNCLALYNRIPNQSNIFTMIMGAIFVVFLKMRMWISRKS